MGGEDEQDYYNYFSDDLLRSVCSQRSVSEVQHKWNFHSNKVLIVGQEWKFHRNTLKYWQADFF